MARIKIVGAGQLGSRHLQALQAIETPLEIHVVDPSPSSLQVARERFEAVAKKARHIAYFNQQFIDTGPTDIAIVATNSNVRRQAVEALLGSSDVKFLVLEKLLFDKPEDYTAVSEIISEKKLQTWVNCPMRVMPVYEKIRERLAGKRISYRVTGSQFGLVTNAIHYLDHVCHLTGTNGYALQTDDLDETAIVSKRAGFLELTGSLSARFENGSRCEITCDATGSAPVIVEISTDSDRYIIRESEGKLWHSGQETNWNWTEETCSIPFQSQITTGMVQSLLEHGTCRFTPFEASKQIHLSLLDPLSKFLGASTETAAFPFT
jgi:predicted dehydrogenase